MKLLAKIIRLTEFGGNFSSIFIYGIFQAMLEIIGLYFLGAFVSMLTLGIASKQIGSVLYLSYDQVACLLAVVYICRLIIGIKNYYLVNKFSTNVETELKYRLLCVYQEMAYQERMRRGVGEMFDAVNNWTSSFSRAIVAPCSRMVCDGLTAVVIVGYFFYLYPKIIFFFAMLLICAVLFWDKILKKKSVEYARQYRVLSSELADELHDTLIGYKEIFALNLAKYFSSKFKIKAAMVGDQLARSVTLAQSPRLALETLLVLVSIISLFFLQHFGIDYQEEIPSVAILAVGLMRLSSLLSLAATAIANVRTYTPTIECLYDDLIVKTKPRNSVSMNDSLNTTVVKIIGNNLEVGHESSPILISNFSFIIECGEKIALVGPSGSGKTTFLNLLIGLHHPANGSFRILLSDGTVKQNLLGFASYLSQETFIIADSIRRNVAIGMRDSDIDDERVIESLYMAQLSEFAEIHSLDKQLGSFGSQLSGGQRQRIALARAFYLNKKVLIFDESTSALDFDTENTIVDQLLNLGNSITVIFVTHRMNIADKFSRKIFLGNNQ